MPSHPNILFILTDQQRRDSMRAYGNTWIQTPNMDRLAAESFVFENAYVTQPVCTPARASIMTGLYPHSAGMIVNNVPLAPDRKTIAEMVPADYHCAHFGKWHLGDDAIPQHGFTEWLSIEDHQRARYTKAEYKSREADYSTFLRKHGVEPPPPTRSYESWIAGANLPEELVQATYLGNEASRFIREYGSSPNAGRPWMLFVNFFEPHPPYTGPLNGLYDPAKLPVGPGFLKRPDTGSLLNRLRADYYMGGNLNPLGAAGGDMHDTTTEAGWRKLRAQYFANVTLVDRNLGRILDALDESGMADDTIVVFTSEHGEMAGDHGMLEKRSLYEEASRVPLLMRVPWLLKNRHPEPVEGCRIPGSIGQVDLVPTLLELAGAPVPGHLEGRSRVPVLEGEAALEDDVFVQWNGYGDRNLGTPEINRMVAMPWRSVITTEHASTGSARHRRHPEPQPRHPEPVEGWQRWKLNLCAADQCELYDLTSDPHELRNLFNDPAHRDRARDMAARIRLWQHTTGDAAPLPAV